MDTTATLLSPQPTTQLSKPKNRRYSATISDKQNQNPILPCPRCDSTNTKFCYYNNYNLSQPRHFCKSCRRYWTHGGTLRPVPVGGGTRNNKSVIHVKRKSPRARPEPLKVSNSIIDPVVSDMGSGPVVVDLNEAWWTGLTSGDGLLGPVGSYGPGILDWPMEAVCWPEEIGILTPGNELK